MSGGQAFTEIRAAGPHDIPALARFLVEAEREHGATLDVSAVERDLRRLHPGPEFLLAVEPNGAIAGFAAYSVLYPRPLLFLKELHIAPAHRRKGIAKRLLAQLARIARERGCPRLGWNSRRDNAVALALYDGLGADRAEWMLSYRLGGEAFERLAASAE